MTTLNRTLRFSGRSANDESDILHLLPQDQADLRKDIKTAEINRATHYDTCRKLRRRAAVFRARCDRLKRTLSHVTDEVRQTVASLERIMGQLRKQFVLMRIQERIYQEVWVVPRK